jgi:hypothetical protein
LPGINFKTPGSKRSGGLLIYKKNLMFE